MTNQSSRAAESGLRIGRGTIVDATIIAAPSSTKNAAGKRDPEMHQAMKGNEWHFGMKAHIGVDSKLKIVRLVINFALANLYLHRRRLLEAGA